MRHLSERSPAYRRAVAAIDAANAGDPTTVVVRGRAQPLALAHGRLAAGWVGTLAPAAGEAVLLAARAHHLRRWELPRAAYPDGRAGYLRWRRDQKARHARDVGALLAAAGHDAAVVARVQALVRRERLARDADAQVVEDAACLVFLETQLAGTAARLAPDRMREILRATAAKMSPAGRAAVAAVPLAPPERALVDAALA